MSVAHLYAPLSLVTPINTGLQIAFGALFARIGCISGIKEHISAAEGLSITVVLCGVVAVTILGPRREGSVAYAKVQDGFLEPSFLSYYCTLLAFLLVWTCTIAIPAFRRCRPPMDSRVTSILSAFGAAASASFTTLFLKAIFFGFEAIIYSSPTPVGGWWLLVVGLVGLPVYAFFQLFLLNSCLGSAKATFTFPIYISLVAVFAIVSGGLL